MQLLRSPLALDPTHSREPAKEADGEDPDEEAEGLWQGQEEDVHREEVHR